MSAVESGDIRTVLYNAQYGLGFRYYPTRSVRRRGSVVFFFGGGWRNGSILHFHHQSLFFAEKGYDCFCVDYRVPARFPGTTPFDCYRDTVRALAALSKGIENIAVDPHKLILSGGSAGGHLALCNAILNRDIQPAALLLYNPVVDTTQAGYGAGTPLFGGHPVDLSPIHLLSAPLPPTYIAHGDKDAAVPIGNILRFVGKARALGSEVRLKIYPGRGHGFFNHPDFLVTATMADYCSVVNQSADFLEEIL